MRTYDFTPLFRSTVGFDRWNDLFDAALRADDSTAGYPLYNIEKTGDDTYRIMMAVAGFGENDVEITAQENLLVVSGNLGEPREGVTYLYRGIATRAFDAASALPITSRSSVRRWPTASCRSTSSVSCPRR